MKNRLFVIVALCLGIVGGALVGLTYAKTDRRPSYEEQLRRKQKAQQAVEKELEGYPQPYVKTVDIVKPSVVQVMVTHKPTPRQGGGITPGPEWPFEDDPFEFFRRRLPQQIPRQPRTGVGSGFIIDRKGHILTNNHVVSGGDEITVVLYDGDEVSARLIGADPSTDLALIKIDADDILPATLGDSETLQVGQEVMAFGSPFRLSFSASRGIVSAINRTGLRLPGEGPTYQDFIQTDAAINPGNSGGPLVNLTGEVIGINAAITSQSGGFEGVGFAIPINMAKEILPQLKEGKVVRGWLGVSLNPDEDIVEQFGADHGVLLDQVFPGTPAAKAGLKRGDVVVAIDGVEIEGFEHLRRLVANLKPDQEVEVKVIRDGEPKTIDVTIGTRPTDMARLTPGPGGEPQAADEPDKLGIKVQDITPQIAEQLEIEDGGVVVSEVEPDSPAARAGIAPGMVISEVARKEVNSVREYLAQVEKADVEKGVLLLIKTPQGTRYVVVKER